MTQTEANVISELCITHSRLLVRHEDSIAGQVVAGTGCVCVVGVQKAAALSGPPAAPRHPCCVPE